MNQKKILLILVLILFLFVCFLALAKKIDLATADLGRHLKNGEVFWQTLTVPQGNFYSYTNPDFPFLNHHWGTGVIFFLIQKMAGWNGLSLFFIALNLGAFIFLFLAGQKLADWKLFLLFCLPAIPLLASRPEIRPEAISYFFSALVFYLLIKFKESGQQKWLWFLPPIFLIWVNCHIYFFFGLFLMGAFWVEEIFHTIVYPERTRLSFCCGKNFGGGAEGSPQKLEKTAQTPRDPSIRPITIGLTRDKLRKLTLIGIISILITLFNPAGLKGLLYPFQIFNNYGYRVLENQTFFFLKKLIAYPATIYFEILFGLLILSWLWRIFWVARRQEKFPVALFLISVFVSYLGIKAVRNFALFGLMAPVLIAANVASQKLNEFLKKKEAWGIIFLVIALFACFFWAPNYLGSGQFGLELSPGAAAAGEFFLKQKITGPIFNNYDLGGYLIYYLYPQQKVFVDNRPEAYPAEFFQNDYIAAQESDARWQKLDEKYNFNAIFFYRLDLTPWGQNFLITRAKDLNWRVVFVDEENIIFVKDNAQNKKLIEKYGLPREMFGAAPSY
ncbi:MAG: hypothetical protein PHT40_03715 [Patescibacteria group bacterium]|nr:hypothetical protein [Patescibacteria group bacterium]